MIMRQNDRVSLGDLYGDIVGDMRNLIVKENAVKSPPQNAFSDKSSKPKLAGGPESADGFNKSLHDQIMDGYDNPSKNKVNKTSGSKREATDYFGTSKPKPKEEDEETEDEDDSDEKDDKKKKKVAPEEDEEDGDDSDEEGDDEETPKKKKEWVKPWDKDKDKDKDKEEDEETISESKKIAKPKLNTNMSRKSTFDKLYERVLKENFGMEDDGNDLDALGIEGEQSDADLGDDFGGEDGGEEDTVTFTLDRATAQTLIEVLQGALGDEGGEDDFGDEGDDEGLDFGDEGGEDDGMDFDEDEEGDAKAAPDKSKVFQSKNNKVGGKVKPKSGKASSEVTDEVGTKTNASTSYNDGKNNKVNAGLKTGAEFFK